MAGAMDYDVDVDVAYADESLEQLLEIANEPPTHVSVEPRSVLDVAAAFLRRLGPMDTYKLQKLCYYAQAQHVAMYDTRLFKEPIEAWANGPVIPKLWSQHAGKRTVEAVKGGVADAVEDEPASADTLTLVADVYGSFTGAQLSEMTHRERPWTDAREGLRPKAHSSAEISVVKLRDYYRSFPSIEPEDVPDA